MKVVTTKSVIIGSIGIIGWVATANAQTVDFLAAFPSASSAQSVLVQGRDGNFYGTTSQGGNSNNGTIFQVTPAGVLTTLYSFCTSGNCSDGQNPNGLIQASDGNFYGTTNAGGSQLAGTVFKVTATGALTTLYNFCSVSNCVDGNAPSGGLVQGSDGNFYGTDYSGGANNCGTVFKITSTGALTTLHSFCAGGDDGEGPTGALVQAADGNFYGTTNNGGANTGGGTVFKVSSTGVPTSTIYSFCNVLTAPTGNCSEGTTPYGGLTLGTDGNFYGVAAGGVPHGSYQGTIFKITPAGAYTLLYQFCSKALCQDGGAPNSPLVQASDGNFYGTTQSGGFESGGTVFRITPAGGFITPLYDFYGGVNSLNYTVDSDPLGALIQGRDGKLYGTTSQGGSNDSGSVFSLPQGRSSLAGTAALGSQADYFGQLRSEYTVWRPSTGTWYSVDGIGDLGTPQQWGEVGDKPVVGDYDADGESDVAVFRPSNGYWYITLSTTAQVLSQQWGEAGDIPVPGDYDGDGKTDIAVWRPSNGTWYIIPSSNPSVPIVRQWGLSGDIPVPSDYDGDGKTDIAVWRPSNGTWYLIQSNTNQVVSEQWGESGDVPVPGYYEGLGNADIAVWRPSTGIWYIVQSSNHEVVTQQWGEATDIPVARDYDGDGKTDIAVWRASTGYWYVISSSTNRILSTQWGAPGDIPVNKPAGQ